MSSCPNCGERVDPSNRYCTHCGGELSGSRGDVDAGSGDRRPPGAGADQSRGRRDEHDRTGREHEPYERHPGDRTDREPRGGRDPSDSAPGGRGDHGRDGYGREGRSPRGHDRSGRRDPGPGPGARGGARDDSDRSWDDEWQGDDRTPGGHRDGSRHAGDTGWDDNARSRGRGAGAHDTRRGPRPDSGRPRQERGNRSQGHGQAHRQQPSRRGQSDNKYIGRERYIEDGKAQYAFFFPVSGGLGPVGIGAVLTIFSVLLIPILPFIGYTYRVVGAAANGATVQPGYDDFVELTKEGFFVVILMILFSIASLVAIGGPLVIALAVDVPAIGLLAVLSGLLVWYVAPAVFTLYGVTGSIGSALSLQRIRAFAFTGHYFVSYMIFLALYFALTMGFFIVVGVLFITVIGILVAIPLYLMYGPFMYYLSAAYWGGTYYEAVSEGLVAPPEVNRLAHHHDDRHDYPPEPQY